MKKAINKNIIFGFILGLIVMGGIGVGATVLYNSNQILYSSDKTEKKKVNDALDELYNKVNTPTSLKIKTVQAGNGASDRRANAGLYIRNEAEYNKLKVGSRTAYLASTMAFDIYGYSDYDCSKDMVTILNASTTTNNLETYDISQYKCIGFRAYSYMDIEGYQRFNNIEFSKE